jgi:peptide/nickel transport system permease protein
MLPGDPILFIVGASENELSPEQVAAIRAEYGLEPPVYVQFTICLGKAQSGDLGRSFQSRQPVLDIIVPPLLPTAQIAVETWMLATFLGIGMGILSGYSTQ